jgi:hypothetical protein
MRLREGQVPGAGWTLRLGEGRRREYCCYSSVALFVMGRIGAGHPGIVVTDDPVARTFKQYFPGP